MYGMSDCIWKVLSLSIHSLWLQCCIDLKKNVLHIGTTGTEATFLAEASLKEKDSAFQAKKQVRAMSGHNARTTKPE